MYACAYHKMLAQRHQQYWPWLFQNILCYVVINTKISSCWYTNIAVILRIKAHSCDVQMKGTRTHWKIFICRRSVPYCLSFWFWLQSKWEDINIANYWSIFQNGIFVYLRMEHTQPSVFNSNPIKQRLNVCHRMILTFTFSK